jgi:hypothetical protein
MFWWTYRVTAGTESADGTSAMRYVHTSTWEFSSPIMQSVES